MKPDSTAGLGAIAELLREARQKRDLALSLGAYERAVDADYEPHRMPLVPPSARESFLRYDPSDPAWKALLEQVGMRVDEEGKYWRTRPTACEHSELERNVNRDQLTCDGCRRDG